MWVSRGSQLLSQRMVDNDIFQDTNILLIQRPLHATWCQPSSKFHLFIGSRDQIFFGGGTFLLPEIIFQRTILVKWQLYQAKHGWFHFPLYEWVKQRHTTQLHTKMRAWVSQRGVWKSSLVHGKDSLVASSGHYQALLKQSGLCVKTMRQGHL